MQIYRKVERVTEQAGIYDVKILWSRYMVCVASLERYFTSVGLVFSSWKIDIMSKTTKKSWKIIYFDFSGLFSCVDCRNQYVMLGLILSRRLPLPLTFLFCVESKCTKIVLVTIFRIFILYLLSFADFWCFFFNKNAIERKLFWRLSIMRKLMNQWILMANFNTSGYIDMETRFMYLSHSVFFFPYIFVTSCVETFVSNIVHCSELRNLMVELSS